MSDSIKYLVGNYFSVQIYSFWGGGGEGGGGYFYRNGKFLTLFYPEIYRSKFLCDQIIKAIGLILRHNMFGVPIIFLLLQLISKYAQKSK